MNFPEEHHNNVYPLAFITASMLSSTVVGIIFIVMWSIISIAFGYLELMGKMGVIFFVGTCLLLTLVWIFTFVMSFRWLAKAYGNRIRPK